MKVLLNNEQKEAVESIIGPLLIIAGPGSGKTRTLVERIIYMLEEKKIEPRNILITTFTERAARELITRISERIKDKSVNLNELYIGTIHSVCLKIIDEYIFKTGLYQGYEILDDINQKFFIYRKMKEFKEIDEYEEFFKGRYLPTDWKKAIFLQKWFNRLSEENISLDDIEKKNIFLRKSYEKYSILLKINNLLDFGSIQRVALNLIENNSDVLLELREKIRYIMVDEYQDTNKIQERIIFLLGGENGNICVVGDDDQGIYRFRGATVKNILLFPENFPEGVCKIIKLTKNYRSPWGIVDFCKEWINSLQWDKFRYPKEIEAVENKDVEQATVVKLSVKNSEIQWMERIYKFLLYLKEKEIIENYNQIAFLSISVKDKRMISLGHYLEKKGIKIYSPRSNLFFYREEIRNLIGVFLNIFPKITEKIMENPYNSDIKDYYRSSSVKIEKESKNYKELREWIKKKKKYYEDNFKGKEGLLDLFYEIISLEIFKKYLENKTMEVIENREAYNLGIFSKILKDFEILSKVEILTTENLERAMLYFFNSHLKFLKDNGIDEYEEPKELVPKNAISFLTIHQSKGLEFPVVIIGSLDRIPIGRENITDKDLEQLFKKEEYEPSYRTEEFDFWRLFYTGFSRAKNLLILSCIENETGKKIVPSLPFKRLYDKLPDVASGALKFENLKLDIIENSKLKETYTFTGDINLYNRCPFKYKLTKIFKIESKKSLGAIYGTLIHETMEKLHILILEKGLENIIEEDIFKIYYKIYLSLKESTNVTLGKSILNKGLNQINDYLKNEKEILNHLKNVEEKISLVEDCGILEGTLDMIIEENNKYSIIDFKTGDVPENEELLEGYKNQIKFYSYLLHKRKNFPIKEGILYFIKNQKKEIIPITDKDLIEIEKFYKNIIERIKENQFQEKKYDKVKCKNCEYFHYCTLNS